MALKIRFVLPAVDKAPFELTETGWGEFEIQIKIFFVAESGEKPLTVNHLLKLHPWPISLASSVNNLNPLTPLVDATGPAEEEPLAEDASPATTIAEMDVDPLDSVDEQAMQESATIVEDVTAVATSPIFSPVHSWQYDEIVFNEPTEAFYATLISVPVTPL